MRFVSLLLIPGLTLFVASTALASYSISVPSGIFAEGSEGRGTQRKTLYSSISLSICLLDVQLMCLGKRSQSGPCGCGWQPADIDGDGINDYCRNNCEPLY